MKVLCVMSDDNLLSETADSSYPEQQQDLCYDISSVPQRSQHCRSVKTCPVMNCRSKVIHLPRHLREQHGWTNDKARSAVKYFGLRQIYTKPSISKAKYKDYHKLRPCPVENCSAVIKRLSSHLQCHKIAKHSKLYNELIAKAKQRRDRIGNDAFDCDVEVCETAPTIDVSASVDSSEALSFFGSSEAITPTVDASNASIAVGDSYAQTRSSDDTVLELELSKFDSWLQSADGGLKHSKSAKQHVAQVRAVLKSTEQNTLPSLWDKNVLDKFLNYMDQRKFLPATKKSYLNSLNHLYKFVTCEDLYSDGERKVITQMKDRVTRWSTAIRKDYSKHQLQKMDEDLNKLISPKDLNQFKSSDIAVAAVKLIGSLATNSEDLTLTDYVTVRDFLLTNISLANANRSGVLSTMTVKQFLEARPVDSHYVASVVDHKTASSYGPAKIVFTETLRSWLNIYVLHIRSRITPLKPELFLTWNGDSMTSGQITRAVQSIWNKAGLGSAITHNIIRKSAVSTVHNVCPDVSTQLADLMCHRVTTAQKCYRVVEREKTSVAAAKKLCEAFTHHESTADASIRLTWNEDQLKELMAVFGQDYSDNISLSEVRAKIKHNSILNAIGERKVYDRLRSDSRRRRENSEPVVLPQETETVAERVGRLMHHEMPAECALSGDDDADSDFVSPSTESIQKDIFSGPETASIKKLCAPIISAGPVSDSRITAAMNASPVGVELMSKFSLFQLKNRIKYERRKKSKKFLIGLHTRTSS